MGCKGGLNNWLVSEWSLSFQGLQGLEVQNSQSKQSNHSALTNLQLAYRFLASFTSTSKHVWTWQGRQGLGQGRRQEAPQGAA